MIMRHLYVDISAHGLGHLAQVAPVLAALRNLCPEMRLTIASALPRERLARRIAEPFTHLPQASDFGFAMHNAVDIDFVASAHRYREFHGDWDARVALAAQALRAQQIDLVLSNAAYLPLAAAAQAGVPAFGMCSLNWADLFQTYFTAEAWAAEIHAQILAAYNSAQTFLRVTPGMPMPDFVHRRDIGPVAALASLPRAQARARLGAALTLNPAQTWVLVAMGGMEFRLPVEQWPAINGVVWLCPQAWNVQRDDVRAFDRVDAGLSFTDLLGACDAVLTKPGYGTFVEATCNDIPVLYVPRGNWPEEAPMVEWVQQQGRIVCIERETLMAGELAPALQSLLAQPRVQVPAPSGISEAATLLATVLA